MARAAVKLTATTTAAAAALPSPPIAIWALTSRLSVFPPHKHAHALVSLTHTRVLAATLCNFYYYYYYYYYYSTIITKIAAVSTTPRCSTPPIATTWSSSVRRSRA